MREERGESLRCHIRRAGTGSCIVALHRLPLQRSLDYVSEICTLGTLIPATTGYSKDGCGPEKRYHGQLGHTLCPVLAETAV